jgi:hypothetical protein
MVPSHILITLRWRKTKMANVDGKMLGKYGLWMTGAVATGVAGYFLYKYIQKVAAQKIADEEKQIQKEKLEDPANSGNSIVINGVEYDGSPADVAKYIVQNAIEKDAEDAKNGVNWDGTPREEVVEQDLPKKTEKVKKKRPEKGEKPVMTDYAALSKKMTKEPLKEVAKEILGDEAVEETEEDPDEAHVISFEEFAMGQQKGFSKMSLTYYEKDDVLCDPNKEVVHTPEELLGPDGLLKFGEESGDPDCVYIRNPLTSTDYDVVILHNKSYQIEVLGVKPERKPERNRRVVRKVTNMDEESDE